MIIIIITIITKHKFKYNHFTNKLINWVDLGSI